MENQSSSGGTDRAYLILVGARPGRKQKGSYDQGKGLRPKTGGCRRANWTAQVEDL